RDARVAKRPHLFLLQVRLRLVEQLDLETARREGGQEVVEVAHVEDVVDNLDLAARMLRHDRRQFLERALARLAPVRHRLTVEAAERAVLLLAPPAAARRFEEQARLPR